MLPVSRLAPINISAFGGVFVPDAWLKISIPFTLILCTVGLTSQQIIFVMFRWYNTPAFMNECPQSD